MIAARRKFIVERIVVAVDSSAQGRAALEAATALGAQLHAQVQGLFVEDIDLVNLSDLPFGREVHLISGRTREFDRAALEAQLRAEAAQARRALEAHARRARVRCSFRVVRGRVETEVIAAAGDADLLILGTASRPIGPGRGPGSTAVAAAERAPRSVLLSRPEASVRGRPLVAFDGTEGSDLALDAALSLVADRNDGITVLLVAATDGEQASLRERAEARIGPHDIKARFVRADTLDLDGMCRLSREAGADILVLSADAPVLAEKGHRRLIEQIACPVLLVRR